MPGTCSILDLVTGGGSLPHVYCKSVKLENTHSAGNSLKVKVNLEIYQDKNNLKGSSLLNSLVFEGSSISDFIKIQIVPFRQKINVQVLDPTYMVGKEDGPGNPYLVSGHPKTKETIQNNNLVSIFPIKSPVTNNLMLWDTSMFAVPPLLDNLDHIPSPIQVYNSSLTSDILGENYDLLSLPGKQTFSREEVIDGKVYYVIPFEYTWESFFVDNMDLGFLFFSFLDVPHFLSQQADLFPDGAVSEIASLLGSEVITGPPSTEIVFLNGKIPQTRKQFLLADGKIWNGAVHLHHCDLNPDPTGYCGDGGMGTPSGTGFRGWMAGEKHKEAAPKLKLVEVPNYKIQDFRSTPKIKTETLLGLEYKYNDETGAWERHLPENERAALRAGIASLMSPHTNPYGFFQKDTRKYLQKYDMPAGTARSNSLYDSDSEFSKLYVSRDKLNSARGIFFIDFERLLNNNSFLYDRLDGADKDMITQNCLTRSRLVELKLYRDRVKKKTLGKNYEKYANDTSYEESSYLVGTLHDDENDYGVAHAVEGTVTDQNKIQEIILHTPAYNNQTKKLRAFTFTDVNVGTKTAGLYQYRVEMLFKDGTFEYLNSLLISLLKAKVELEDYYNFSLGSRNSTNNTEFSYNSVATAHGANPEIGLQTKIISYYQNGSFISDFIEFAQNRFYGSDDLKNPWNIGTNNHPTVLRALSSIASVFGDSNFFSFSDTDLAKHLSPMTGSPEGIDLVIKLAGSVIGHLQKLVRANRVNKTGSEIDTTTPGPDSVGGSYNFNNFFDFVVSPSMAIIKEDHSFDNPLELHKALSNEDIYVDYLSLGTPDTQITTGPIMMSVPAYKNRCQLETMKYSSWAGTNAGFQGTATGDLPNNGMILDNSPLEQTAYTYLAPSIIELSSPIDENEAYNSYISFFHPGAQPDQEATGLQEVSIEKYDKVFIALVNYGLGKDDVDDSDLMPNYYKSSISPNEVREQYKNLFNLHNVTIHTVQKHAKIFDKGLFHSSKSPGAESNKEEFTTINQFVPEEEDFSDILVNGQPLASEGFYKPFFSDDRNLFKTPKGSVLASTNAGAPNILKLRKHVDGANYEGDPSSGLFSNSIQGTKEGSSPDWNSYYFINTNMISQIEYYDGSSVNNDPPGPLKNDQNSWKPISISALDNLDDGALFCRTVTWQPGAALSDLQGINLPVINKYFLLTRSSAGDELNFSESPFMLPPVPSPKINLENTVDFVLGQAEIKKQETLKDPRNLGKIRAVPRGSTSKTRNEVIEKRRRLVEEPQPKRKKRKSSMRKRRSVEDTTRRRSTVEQIEEITTVRTTSTQAVSQPTRTGSPMAGAANPRRGTSGGGGGRSGGSGQGGRGGGGTGGYQ